MLKDIYSLNKKLIMSRPINEVTLQSFYLIPRDKETVPGFDHDLFLKVIDQSLEHVKSWYDNKLGCTFQFINTIKLISDKNFNWFSINDINQDMPTSLYNCVDQIKSKNIFPSKNRPILCYLYGGFQGCAAGDFSFLPLEDVFLLLKEYNEKKPARWHGGLAHVYSGEADPPFRHIDPSIQEYSQPSIPAS